MPRGDLLGEMSDPTIKGSTMIKRLIAGVLVATLLVPGSAALAGKKKKKGPKPWTSEELTIGLAHPVFYGNSGDVLSVTAQEFHQTCAIPATQDSMVSTRCLPLTRRSQAWRR